MMNNKLVLNLISRWWIECRELYNLYRDYEIKNMLKGYEIYRDLERTFDRKLENGKYDKNRT